MILQKRGWFSESIYNRKYSIFLVSLLILLFGELLYVPKQWNLGWQHIVIVQNVFAGLILFNNEARWKRLLLVFFAFAMTFQCFLLFVYANDLLRSILTQLFVLYFLAASYIIFRDLINAKKVGKEILAGAFSGFIILGIIGGFLYTLLEIYQPNSFSNIGTGETKFQNLSYFSFISLLTIGYGDIAPINFFRGNWQFFLD